MVTTARRKHSHMLCFKCVEEADAAFTRLAQACGMSKGDLFVQMLADYQTRVVDNDEVFFAKHKLLQQELSEMISTTIAANERAQLKKGRPAGADEAAAVEESVV